MGISCSNCQNILRGIDHQQQEHQNDNNQKLDTEQVFDCEVWNFYNLRWFKKIVQIVTITNVNERKYFFDGQLLRIESSKNQSVGFQNFTNLEQLNHLNWSGKYGQLNQKVGKWITTWKGEVLRDAGGWYSDDEKKQGLWIELTKNYRNQAEVYESGYYLDDQRYGMWKYIYDEELIDAGRYNFQGQKNGKWTQLSDRFCYYSKIKYNGEYKNGKKVGLWNIWYQDEYRYINKLMYFIKIKTIQVVVGHIMEMEIKLENGLSRVMDFKDSHKSLILETIETIRKLVDGIFGLSREMVRYMIQQHSQIIYIGEYRKGKKIGRWDIFELGEMIGGGSYDELDSIKIGKWIELSDFFGIRWQTTYNGEYKKGKKINRWDIEKRDEKGKPFYNIGGGSYDSEQGSIKIGKWFEFNDDYHLNQYMTTNGEYKNGYKIGRWETLWTTAFDIINKLIACGSYDEISSNKIGKWIEISDNFCSNSQVTYIGEYKNGIKVGRWDTYFLKHFGDRKNELIGGGSYDEEHGQAEVYESGYYLDDQRYGMWKYIYDEELIDAGRYNFQGQKNGKWTQLSDRFCYYSKIKYNGEYKNGKKVGLWNIWYQDEYRYINKLIGGGSYNGDGNKIGKWIEQSDGFQGFSQITYIGDYRNDKKIGRWDIWFKQGDGQIHDIIGGGSYDEDGNKIGKWVQLSEGFQEHSQIIYIGEYRKGKKIGRWDIFELGEMIGGGSYDELDSIKIGKWIELSDFFGIRWQTTYNGEYKKGKKINRWDIEKRDEKGKPFYNIGGGSYDSEQGSIKIGKWFEFNDDYHLNQYMTTNGEYKNGYKIGRWETLWTTAFDIINKLIACGSYDEISSNKIGKWIEISDNFCSNSQVTYIGEYKNGIKVGRWDTYFLKHFGDRKNELIGGGSYDEEHGLMKIGKWIDLGHLFNSDSQVTYIGEYRSGKRVGKWEIWFEQIYGDNKLQQVGGGSYDEEQGCIKVGRWIELSDNFDEYSQITFKGEYKNSRKIGRWDIWYKKYYGEKTIGLVGGGQYNEQQGLIKFGCWIDVCDSFAASQQCTLTGQYKNSRKVGIWQINCKIYDEGYDINRWVIFEQ
ncbi:unnamed protein product [Paramecium primaurelia]|uniref:Uncharacterized protein n=1 Tax=Paramecium primaurelia TaxID=5886 RepID=A0A8S1QNC1_PARPR|nr:unnamed protein product [Paramecium primaurelia]